MLSTLRLIVTKETVPYRNLALEELLIRHVKPGECILYLWQNRHTVVIGRNQNPWRECRVEALEQDGGFLARRSSGGGAVFHDLGNLNFTFVTHEEDYDLTRQLAVVVSAAARLGIPAEQSGRNDICVGEKKISGNAFQHRDGKGCHHGTILIDADMTMLSRYLTVSPEKMRSKGVSSVKSRVANLVDFAPGVTVAEVSRLLAEQFGKVYGLPVLPMGEEELPPDELEEVTAHFASWEWRLGRPIPFTQELSRRFPWGEITLQLEVDGGVIRQAAAFSDANNADFVAALPAALRGRPFHPGELTAGVKTIPAPDEGTKLMAADILYLIELQFK